MRITLDNKIRITSPPPELAGELQRRLTFKNPAFLEAEQQGRWTGNIPRTLTCLDRAGDGLTIPRGFIYQLVGVCRKIGVNGPVLDNRRTLPEVNFTFTGKLRDFQAAAIKDVVRRDFGTLTAPTGSGKTVMALSVIASRRQPALVIVHTRELLNQWVDRASTFLDLDRSEIGVVGGGKLRIGDRLTVGMVQTLCKCAADVAQHIGHLIVDECHHAPSRTFTEAVTAFHCKFQLGLSATPYRRDGLTRLIYWYLGDMAHEVDRAGLIDDGYILETEIIQRETKFQTYLDASENYQEVLTELTQDAVRNGQIVLDVAQVASNGSGACLVLTDRKEHALTLFSALEQQGVYAAVLTGDTRAADRRQIVEDLDEGRQKVVIATGQLLGEGFDCRNLSTLFLATPLKFSGRLLQYLGRVLRPAPGKQKALVYDYADNRVPVLRAGARARLRTYQEKGVCNGNVHRKTRGIPSDLAGGRNS